MSKAPFCKQCNIVRTGHKSETCEECRNRKCKNDKCHRSFKPHDIQEVYCNDCKHLRGRSANGMINPIFIYA